MAEGFKEENGMYPNIAAHTLSYHLNKFPPSNSDFSDENGEKIHQELKRTISLNSNASEIKILGSHIWRLTRSSTEVNNGRKFLIKSFFAPRE